MPVNTYRKDYSQFKEIWTKTRDAIAGEEKVKFARFKYLPQLYGQKQEDYMSYLTRARYINFVGRVRNVGIGQIFRKTPVLEDIADDYMDNADLTGRSFTYFMREVSSEIMTCGRVGVLVDYSEDQARPYLTMYTAESIINWHTDIVDGITKLSLLVVEGTIDQPKNDDIYEVEEIKTYKEFILKDGVYKVRDYTKSPKDKQPVLVGEYTPIINDNTFNYIPFYVITPDGISYDLKPGVLTDIANINLGHYVNSADYENMLHWTGARTIIVTGYNETECPFAVGGVVALDANGSASYLEAKSDSALEEAMKRKEEQMAAIGSAILSGKGRYVASAQTAQTQSQGEYATLADIANALSCDVTKIMSLFMEWDGKPSENVRVEFNTDFDMTELVFSDLTPLLAAVGSGNMSKRTYFNILQQKEVYPKGWTYEDEQEAIAEDLKDSIARRDAVIGPQQNNMNGESDGTPEGDGGTMAGDNSAQPPAKGKVSDVGNSKMNSKDIKAEK
jgi:hypothetical protein